MPLLPVARAPTREPAPLNRAGTAPQPILAADGSGNQACRPYSSETTVTGLPLPVRGLACRDADGHWQLVSEVPGR
jgi:hypothetical protein